MSGTFKALMIVLGLACAAPAAGQALPRHDVSGLFGWSNAKRPRPGVPYDYWIGAWFGTGTAGWYWSDHQKTEVSVAVSTERQHAGEFEFIENAPQYTTRSTSDFLRTQTFSGAHVYQFFRNAFAHPFVGAGVEVDRERWRAETLEQTYLRKITPPFQDELVSSALTKTTPEIRLKARAFVLTGFKAYFNERTFFRADVRVSAGRSFDRFSWRVGGGFDF